MFCREEWEWVRGISRGELPTSPPSEVQATFVDDLTEASQRLLKKLGKFHIASVMVSLAVSLCVTSPPPNVQKDLSSFLKKYL